MLLKQIAFDHCQKADALSASVIAANAWLSTSGFAGTQVLASNGSSGVISLDGWLAFGITSAWYGSASAYTYLNIMNGPSTGTKLTIGMRIRSYTTYNGGEQVLGISVTQVGAVVLMTYSEMASVRPAGGTVEFYLELILDFTAKTKDVWVDGVFKSRVAWSPNATIISGFAAGTLQVMFTHTIWVGPVVTHWYKDIYVTDDVVADGNALVGRQGPQKMLPITIDQATGPWVSDDGVTDLKLTLNAPVAATAQLVSPTSKDPLNLSLACNVPDGYKVNAIDLSMAARSAGDIPTKTRVEISQGGTTLAPINLTTPKSLVYGQRLGALPLAPDGGPWTAAKIDQTTIVLRPDQ